MESSNNNDSSNKRLPLSEVVSECINQWFKDTLKDAKAGNINMQILVGQMYYNGYGIPRDAQKVHSLSLRRPILLIEIPKSLKSQRMGYFA
ncbi:hypothetical protein I3843_10G122400 [Carya illinoinensis]|nr:hypothetical protein I3843_10G122400 [Carya illinoinensis]